MNRRSFLLLPTATLTSRSGPKIHAEVTGHFSAHNQEIDEGYFALGQEVAVVTKPNTYFHSILRGIVGREIRLSITDPVQG